MHELYCCSQPVPLFVGVGTNTFTKSLKPIIQAVIRSKMAIVPFPFGNSVLVREGYLPEKLYITCQIEQYPLLCPW
jgi:hypothetical protein